MPANCSRIRSIRRTDRDQPLKQQTAAPDHLKPKRRQPTGEPTNTPGCQGEPAPPPASPNPLARRHKLLPRDPQKKAPKTPKTGHSRTTSAPAASPPARGHEKVHSTAISCRAPPQPRIVAGLTRISHHLPTEARDRPASTSLRLLAVLNVLSSTLALVKRRAPRTDAPLTHFASPRDEKCRLVEKVSLAQTQEFSIAVIPHRPDLFRRHRGF